MRTSLLIRFGLALVLLVCFGGTARADGLDLPFSGSVTSNEPAFSIFQRGAGQAGNFQIKNIENDKPALHAHTFGTGAAGTFHISNTENTQDALHAHTRGTGRAGAFHIKNTDNGNDALSAITNGAGWAGKFLGQGTSSRGVYISAPKGQSALEIGSGYAQLSDNNAGAPPAADCDADYERGRLSIDTNNNRLYICNGAARGWDYVALKN